MVNLLSSASFERPAHLLAEAPSFQYERILLAVDRCQTLEQLRNFIYNAHIRRVPEIRNAAFRKLAYMSRRGDQDDLENAVRQLIAVYHTRLTPSRCYKIKSEKYDNMLHIAGPLETLLDMRKYARFSDMSQFLVGIDLIDLTLESVIIRFSDQFERKMVNTSKKRLKAYQSLSSEKMG